LVICQRRISLRRADPKYPELDVVFTSNDQMALGVLHCAHAHKHAIPKDLAVIVSTT